MVLVAFLISLAATTAATAPAPTLGAHATEWAKAQGAGCVVTAERIDGAWRYARGGEAFPAGHAAVAPERVEFEIGSISKVFTGLLLAHAVTDGKLAFTDTLAQRLPVEFESDDTGRITLRQLATHTSCLPRLPDNMGAIDDSDPYAKYDDAALFAYLAQAKLAQAPPCESAYSNLGFGVLGVVLERSYQKPWAALVREKITAPLGMTDTAQDLSVEQRSRFTQGWDGTERAAPWTFQAIAGAGALRSTAADLAKFADALAAGATGPLEKVWPSVTDTVDAAGLGGRVGLALIQEKIDGEDCYGHEGGTGGFRSALRVFPKSGRAQILLASNARAVPSAWFAALRAEGRPAVERTEVARPSAELDGYVGVYTLSPQARFTVLKLGDGLRVRLTGQPFLPVFASAKDEFFYKAVDAQLSFGRGTDGKVDRVTLHQNGRDLPAARSADPVPQVEFPPAESLTELVGEYDFGSYQPGSTIKVQARGDVLTAQLTGQPAFPVFASAKDRFDFDVVEATLTIERDTDGKVVAVVLHQNGADMRAPRK